MRVVVVVVIMMIMTTMMMMTVIMRMTAMMMMMMVLMMTMTRLTTIQRLLGPPLLILLPLCVHLQVGIGLGGVPVAFTLFMEFIPSANRGRWLVVIESFWTIGTFFEAGIAWAVLPTLGWRWLLGISAAPQVLLVILYPFLPESPYWLASKGRRDQATRVLARVAKINGSALPKGLLQVSTASKPEAEEEGTSSVAAAKGGRGACGLFRGLGGLVSTVGRLYSAEMRQAPLIHPVPSHPIRP